MDWAGRYAENNTPWDLGMAHPELARRIEEQRLVSGGSTSALVPGCGRGHDALALARAGFKVTGVDVVEALGGTLGPGLEAHGGRFVVADALTHREPHSVLFEHTFFCALDPTLRPRYGEMAAACVALSGSLHAIVFPLDRPASEGGPPFAMTTEALAQALGDSFKLVEDSPIAPVPGRAWGARWASFRRVP